MRIQLRHLISYLPRFGCVATGIVYSGVGVIAMLSFLNVREGGADESSMLEVFDKSILGEIFIWIVLAGTVSYIVWRFYEAVADPYDYGKDWKGMLKRIGIALSTLADMLIVYAQHCKCCWALAISMSMGNPWLNAK